MFEQYMKELHEILMKMERDLPAVEYQIAMVALAQDCVDVLTDLQTKGMR